MGKGSVGKSAGSSASRATGQIDKVGLRGAPAEAEHVGANQQDTPDVSSQARGVTSSRAHQQQEERPVQYTLRMSYDESDDLDAVARALRKRRGRSTANSDVLRGLVALAKHDPDLQQRLATELENT